MIQITATVRGHTIGLSDYIAGASGGYKTAMLVFDFDTDWMNCDTISLYFTDSKGRSSVFVTLDEGDISEGSYQYAIPAEPLKYPGQMILTIRGTEDSADPLLPSRVIMTAKCEMTVLDSGMPSVYAGEATPVYAVSEELVAHVNDIEEELIVARDSESSLALGIVKWAVAQINSLVGLLKSGTGFKLNNTGTAPTLNARSVDLGTHDYAQTIGTDAFNAGKNNSPSGAYAFAAGYINSASGIGGFVGGVGNVSQGDYGAIFGYGNASPAKYQFASGKYASLSGSVNAEPTETDIVFAHGNGTGVSAKSNAIEATKAGIFRAAVGLEVKAAGGGLKLVSPDGATIKLITIDNSGNLVLTTVT